MLEFTVLRGDANADGAVNLLDFARLAAFFGASTLNFAQADFNYDGLVNLADFNILAGRFGSAVAPAGVLAQRDAVWSPGSNPADSFDDDDESSDELGDLLA